MTIRSIIKSFVLIIQTYFQKNIKWSHLQLHWVFATPIHSIWLPATPLNSKHNAFLNIDPPYLNTKTIKRARKSTYIQEKIVFNCIGAAQAFESDLCYVDYPGPLVRDWVLTAHRRWLQFLYRMFGTGHWRGRGNNLGRCLDRGALSSHFSKKKGKHNIKSPLSSFYQNSKISCEHGCTCMFAPSRNSTSALRWRLTHFFLRFSWASCFYSLPLSSFASWQPH